MNKRYRRLSLAALSLVLGACDAVLGIPERSSDPTVVCGDKGCQCAAGRGDCDGDDSNGCEADFHSVMSCGGCKNQCLNGSCVTGSCECSAGFFDCDGLGENGCETDLRGAGNCGGCGNRCFNGNCIDAVCECKPGFSNCDGLGENGCETFVNNDQDHCGACGHSCLGGSCEDGLCQPVQIFEGDVFDVDLVGDELYFMSAYGLQKLSTSGVGKPTTVCTDAYSYDGFLISGGFAFLADFGPFIVSCPIAGGASKVVFQSTVMTGFVDAFAAGGGWVYWSMFDVQSGEVGVYRAREDGTTVTPELLDVIGYQYSLAADATRVYWTSGSDVYSLTHDLLDTETRSLESYNGDVILGIDAKNLYLQSYSSALSEMVIQVVPIEAGETQTLHGLFCSFECLVAADAQHIYLANRSSGILRRAPLTMSGAGSEILLLDEAFNGSRLVLDDKAVYWGTNQGIFRLAK